MSRSKIQFYQWRAIALLLLLVAIAGPWTYEGVYMPPEVPCTWPSAQPEGNPYCGLAVSGALELGILIPLTVALLQGAATPGQWAVLSILPLLAIFSIITVGLLLAMRRDAPPLLFACAWILAAIAGLGFLNRGYDGRYGLHWGNLLFIAVAAVAFLSELRRSRAGRRAPIT